MSSQIDLEQELRELGRTLVVAPPPDDLAERVLVRVQTEGARQGRLSTWRGWLISSRRRLVAAIVAALLIGLVLTPPVRAAIVEWLRIGGVLIKSAPPPAAPSASQEPLPSSGPGVSLDRARTMVDFNLGVPDELGAPDHVSVSADRRVVSMEWGSGPDRIHLDQFDGRISWVFVKRVWSQVTPTAVNGRDAAWIADTHEIVYIDRDGNQRRAQARISGPCLVWERFTGSAAITLRLEGDLSLGRAVVIAESVR
jgi:hypothetical protein